MNVGANCDRTGTKYRTELLAALSISCLAAITSVSFPSAQEIPWLKTFYPAHFSVEELAYASIVELVRVLLVASPLVMI